MEAEKEIAKQMKEECKTTKQEVKDCFSAVFGHTSMNNIITSRKEMLYLDSIDSRPLDKLIRENISKPLCDTLDVLRTLIVVQQVAQLQQVKNDVIFRTLGQALADIDQPPVYSHSMLLTLFSMAMDLLETEK